MRRQFLSAILRWLLWALLAGLVPGASAALADGEIYIVLSGDSDEYHQVSTQIADRLRASRHGTKRLHTLLAATLDPSRGEVWPADAALVVTVGIRALRRVLEGPGEFPIYAVLVPYASYHALLDSLRDAGRPVPRDRLSVLFLDPQPQRQLRLAAALGGGFRSVGILLPEESAIDVAALQRLARRLDIELKPVRVANAGQVVTRLKRVKKDIDLLITVFDPRLTSTQAIKQILYFSYHRRLPVIGYSSAMVRAGALAAVYSEARQIGLQAAEEIVEALEHRPPRLPAMGFPRYFQASCNKAVGAYFNLQSGCDLAGFSNPGPRRSPGTGQ